MDAQTTQKGLSSNTAASSNISNSGTSSASFKKLQPEEFYRHHIEKGLRPDGRTSLTSFRPVSISVGSISTADGSAIVKQGDTIVVCGIKAELAKPKPETPNQGFVVPNLALPAICHSQFKPGPPSEMAQIASHFIYQVIENSKLINLSDLCIKPGRLVWTLYIDMTCLNYGGNILDVCIKSLCAALRGVKLPHVEMKEEEDDTEGESIPLDEDKDEISVDLTNPKCLRMNKEIPFSCTIAVFDGDKLLVDPTEEEEKLADTTITIVVQIREDKNRCEICHLQKPGGMAISRDLLQKCQVLAKKQAREIQKLINQAVPVPDFEQATN